MLASADMGWVAALTGEWMWVHVELVVVLLGLLRLVLGVRWRTSLIATAVVVVAANVLHPDGARGVMMIVLRPVHAITRYTPDRRDVVDEKPHPWPP